MSRSHSNAMAAAALLSAVFGASNFAVAQPSTTAPAAQTAPSPPPPTSRPDPGNMNLCELPTGITCQTKTPKGSGCVCNGHPGRVR